jgi:hypothetical protein
MSKRIFILITLFSLCASTSTLAQRVGEHFRHFLGFELDEDTLAAIQKRFGFAPLIEKGDAGEYEASISYYFSQCHTVVSFKSDELGGSNNTLEGLVLQNCSSIEANRKRLSVCSSLNCDDLNIGGLKLGMTSKSFVKLYGKSISWRSDTASFTIEGQEPIKTKKGSTDIFDVLISVTCIFEKEILRELNVWICRTN